MSTQEDEFELRLRLFSVLQSNSNARQVFKAIKVLGNADPEIAECHGAYFAKSDRDGVPFYLSLVGTMPRSKRHDCSKFVQEKLHRVCLLAAHTNHKLSRHSVDREIERYPGAVLGKYFGYAISGFPGLVDEMGACAWAVLGGDLTAEEARALVKGNPFEKTLDNLFELKPSPI